MELKNCAFFFLSVVLMIFLLISFSTKSSHWDQISDKSLTLSELPQVYRSLEGIITTDVLLFILCFVTACFFYKIRDNIGNNMTNVVKIVMILWVLLILARFILGVLFLAGENNYCQQQVEYWDSLPQTMRSYLGNGSFYDTLKAAWVFEIVFNVFAYVMGGVLLAILWKQRRRNYRHI